MKRRTIAALVGVVLLGAVAGLNTWVYGDFKEALLPPMEPLPQVGSLSAASCSACHAQIYAEWKRSGHARAFVDPLYQAELRHQPAPFVCHRCHSPLVEQREDIAWWMWTVLPKVVPATKSNDRFDPDLQKEGVTCVACHQVDDHMVGPFDDAESPHPTAVADLRSVDFCGQCHQFGFERIGKLDRPLLDAVAEWKEYEADGGNQVCADCHMPSLPPRVAGQVGPNDGKLRPGTDHSLRGPFDETFVRTGVLVADVTLDADHDGAKASLLLVNGTGHRLPTSEPERFLEVRLAALDAEGNELSHDHLRFQRRADVVKLREIGEDTTLAPRARRELSLSLDALPEDATEVRLSVDYWLWDPEHEAAIEAGLSAEELVHHIVDRRVSVQEPS